MSNRHVPNRSSLLSEILVYRHPTTGHEVWVAIHTKKDAGQLGNRILREAGIL